MIERVAAGALGVALGLRIFQGGGAAAVEEPSLALAGDALVLAAAVLAGARAALAREFALPPARVWAPLLALVAAAWLSLLGAEDVYAGIRAASGWTALATLAVLVLPRGGRAPLAILVAAGAVVAALAWKERFIDLPASRAAFDADPSIAADVHPDLLADFEARLRTDQASGPFLLPNGLGAFLAIAALAGPPALAPIALSGIVLAAQKGTWLALLAGAAACFRHGRRALLVAVPLGALAVALVPSERWERLPGGVSIAVRREYAHAALRMAAERPLLGVGAGNFQHHEPRLKPARGEETHHAHDDWLEALAEMGPLGAAALLAFWGAVLRGRGGADGPAPPPAPERDPRDLPLIGGAAVGVALVGVFGMRYTEPATALAIAAAFLAVALLAHRSARPGPLAAGAVVAFVAQASIDFLHVEPGVVAAALLAASALRPAAPARRIGPAAGVAALLVPFAAFAGLTAGLLPRALEADGARRAGAAAMRARKLDEAARSYARAADALPVDIGARLGLAEALAGLGRREAALAVYADVTRGRDGLADAKARAGDIAGGEAALPWYEAAVRAYPTHPRYRFRLGRALADRDPAAARAHLEAALALDGVVRHARIRLREEERAAARALLERL